jgi:hypothetical protein
MGPQEQFTDVLKSILKKKLEQVVEDNILLAGKGKLTDLNLVQYEKLAREQGFTEVAEDLTDLAAILGFSFIEHFRAEEQSKKQERNYPERRLEDYLTATPERLGLIEKGLKIVDRQYETRSGILDIFTKDTHDKDVVVELKMGKYDNQKVITQIEKYLNDKPDARLIFVAPYISSTVFWKFQPLVEKGQIKFYKVSEKGQDYSITSEDGKNIPLPKKIQFKGKQKQNGPVVYELFNAKKPKTAPKQKKQAELPKEPSVFAGAETIEQETLNKTENDYKKEEREFMQRPLYYKVLKFIKPLADKEKYLSKLNILEGPKKSLDELTTSENLRAALTRFEQSPIKQFNNDEIVALRKQGFEPRFDSERDAKIYSAGMNKGSKFGHLLNEISMTAFNLIREFSRKPYEGQERVVALLNDIKKSLHEKRINFEYDTDLVKLVQLLNKLEKHETGQSLKYVSGLQFMTRLHLEEMTDALLETKIKRTEELMKLDNNLGIAYLAFNPVLAKAIKDLKSDFKMPNDVILRPLDVYNFIIDDNELFSQINNQFVVQKTDAEPVHTKLTNEAADALIRDQTKPLHHRTLTYHWNELKPAEHIENIKITKEQKEALVQLVMPAPLEEEIRRYESKLDWFLPVCQDYFEQAARIRLMKNKTFLAITEKSTLALKRNQERLSDHSTKLLQVHNEMCSSKKPIEPKIQYLKEILTQFNKEYFKHVNRSDVLHSLESLEELANKSAGDDQICLKGLYTCVALSIPALVQSWLTAKISRTEKLVDLDRKVGTTYFMFSPALQEFILFPEHDKDTDVKTNHKSIYEFIKADNELYAQFVNDLKPAAIIETQNLTAHQTENAASQIALSPYELIKGAVTKDMNGVSPEVRLRIDYFAADATSLLPADKIEHLSDAFGDFKIARKFRKREIQPTDVKIRNFFDDVTVQYVRKGEVPDADALERLYERA